MLLLRDAHGRESFGNVALLPSERVGPRLFFALGHAERERASVLERHLDVAEVAQFHRRNVRESHGLASARSELHVQRAAFDLGGARDRAPASVHRRRRRPHAAAPTPRAACLEVARAQVGDASEWS